MEKISGNISEQDAPPLYPVLHGLSDSAFLIWLATVTESSGRAGLLVGTLPGIVRISSLCPIFGGESIRPPDQNTFGTNNKNGLKE